MKISFGKSFLDSYKAYKLLEIHNNKRIDSIANSDSTILFNQKSRAIFEEIKRKSRIAENQIRMLDTIFKSYKKRTGFDFNNADTIIMIYTKSAETNTSNYIILSRTDTISFQINTKAFSKNKYESIINYETFFEIDENGRRFSSQNDTIVKYCYLFKHEALQKIVNDSAKVFDGYYYIVVSGIKTGTNYNIDIKTYRPFVIR
jgi:hypothetical protein